MVDKECPENCGCSTCIKRNSSDIQDLWKEMKAALNEFKTNEILPLQKNYSRNQTLSIATMATIIGSLAVYLLTK